MTGIIRGFFMELEKITKEEIKKLLQEKEKEHIKLFNQQMAIKILINS